MSETRVFTPQEVQALHRRLLEAKEAGRTPSDEDARMAEQVNASPFAQFDRPWRADS